MPRLARTVIADLPYHVTQRGNRKSDVFFDSSDRDVYLELLKHYTQIYSVDVIAYCLMTNHVHFVISPTSRDGLMLLFRALNSRYSSKLNKRNGWTGHLWQNRFFSSILDPAYLYAAIRYVELNPVRAGMVKVAEEYLWSSARAHVNGAIDPVLTTNPNWMRIVSTLTDNWSKWLKQDAGLENEKIKLCTQTGCPFGGPEFVQDLENRTKRKLLPRSPGRPRIITQN